jgi:hypothetical protein
MVRKYELKIIFCLGKLLFLIFLASKTLGVFPKTAWLGKKSFFICDLAEEDPRFECFRVFIEFDNSYNQFCHYIHDFSQNIPKNDTFLSQNEALCFISTEEKEPQGEKEGALNAIHVESLTRSEILDLMKNHLRLKKKEAPRVPLVNSADIHPLNPEEEPFIPFLSSLDPLKKASNESSQQNTSSLREIIISSSIYQLPLIQNAEILEEQTKKEKKINDDDHTLPQPSGGEDCHGIDPQG